MTLAELDRYTAESLSPVLGEREAAATTRLLLEDILGIDRVKLVTSGDRPVEPETIERFRDIIRRISQGEPPQYIVGKARFMGMDFYVSPATLIPRPETAELVDIVTDTVRGNGSRITVSSSNPRILDIGTGSGCIAIALARALAYAEVSAIDISPEALDVARKNALSLHVNVDFMTADILLARGSSVSTSDGHSIDASDFDIIVSNPPYIAESERAAMEARVKDHEPAAALFVPDSDPLKFYRAIVDFDSNATLFFEINPLFSNQLSKMFEEKNFDYEILRDSSGKERFAIARRLS